MMTEKITTNLKQYSEQYDLVKKYLDISGDLLLGLDTDQNVTLLNKKGCELIGFPIEEVLGKNWFDNFVPERLRTSLKESFENLLKENPADPHPCDYTILTKTGEERQVVWVYSFVTNRKGKVIGILSSGEDVTDRRKAETEVWKAEKKYKSLYESMTDGFILADIEGHIRECNSTFVKMLGYSAEEMTQWKYFDFTPEKWHTFEEKIIHSQVLIRGYSDVYEKEYIRKDGSVFPVELRTFLIKDDSGEPEAMWAIVRDITGRKQMENRLMEMNAELENRVNEKTKELKQRIIELERFYRATIDRELRMKELISRIEELESELNVKVT